jgi:choline dehydrogenase-like flavoprotein
MEDDAPEATYDYIVVGSGAGGGTVAARLAEAGMTVLLLEAGGDPLDDSQGEARLPEDYDVPAFHPFASENPAMSWDFFVRHYADPARQARDPKAGPAGVLYPRAGTLGGCTAHNAMILIAPSDADWDGIASLTGDDSWRAKRMRRYFRRIENCRHRPLWRLLRRVGLDPTGHGWSGWLPSERALPRQAFRDDSLLLALSELSFAILTGSPRPFASLWRLFVGQADPNDRRTGRRPAEGVCYTPMTTDGHRRAGTRERLRQMRDRFPDRLTIALHALAARVILDRDNRAVGVDYLSGARLYRAHKEPSAADGERRRALARREVILAGGAFNTPQLLMLSGIGDPEALARVGIACRIPLPGVGRNLQDRYEVGIVHRMAEPWQALKGARFDRGDKLYAEWAAQRSGMYVSNGAALAVIRRSSRHVTAPDQFCMALMARFFGYYPGYSRELGQHTDYLTWAILKAHTRNRAGRVTLRSADPRDMPEIVFNSFDATDDPEGADLKAVVDAIRFVRSVTRPLIETGLVIAEELPGPQVESDAELAGFVRDNAWGHHASCSCPIGTPEAGGVLDSAFRVHGARGLRVVDASVFPRIPGFFIASAVYMIAEKAADAILETARC